MKRLDRRQVMRSVVIDRVLSDPMKRSAIGSVVQLRDACRRELAEHGAAIAAEVDRQFARATDRLGLRCAVCDEPIEGARRATRWYCSGRCRQRAYRRATT